ncbi:MAG: ABC transporter substrate-binding protein [Bacillota bacterium]|nr:ABC transporter substrate-binding protein [Bacillota bacterium]
MPQRWMKIVTPVLVLALAAALTVGCGGNGAQQPGPGQGARTAPAVYTIADDTGDWGFPSPFAHYERGPGYIRMSLLFDTLVWKDDKGFVPALAESWSCDGSGRVWTFKLRDGVRWHDGRPCTAADAAFTFNYAREHTYAFTDLTPVQKAEAPDKQTLVVTLDAPYAPFLDNIAGTLPIIPKHIWSGVEDPAAFREPAALVGTGPFEYGDYNKAQGTYRYLANEDYYGGKVTVKELRFVKMDEGMTAAALQRKEINAGSIPPENRDVPAEAGFTVIKSPYYWNAKLMINHRKEPFGAREFRQALAYAIDRQEIVDVAQRGQAMVGNPGFIPPDSEWYAPGAEQYGHSPEKAAALLESLGYRKGPDGFYARDGRPLEVELLCRADQTRDAELIKRQLAQVGVGVDLVCLESKTVDDRVLKWDFDLAVSGHGGLGGDPVQFNRAVLGKGFNSARFDADPGLGQALKAQVRATDEAQRKALVQKAQELYARDVPALTLYYPDRYWAHDGTVPLFYTRGGVASGVPVPLNKMSFVK